MGLNSVGRFLIWRVRWSIQAHQPSESVLCRIGALGNNALLGHRPCESFRNSREALLDFVRIKRVGQGKIETVLPDPLTWGSLKAVDSLPVPGNAPRRRTTLLRAGLREALYRPSRSVQDQPIPLAPDGRSGMANPGRRIPATHRGLSLP